ncbi:hypothetical protein GPECTOR_5000g1276 [Gonium pectorale]|uniref:Integrase catalytic domain-containing protein n=1 Tax=Gonium pectorale TaxID=33097 RepID=A0A150H605_GONPE|nr:hypothetical protein GPECTOR_5000g1276 [Gonium pectorale]|eukprot:KXZ57050.1 hypothetical protein GPECTOR_5000g1276 [Gonium pectorale]
MPSAVPDPPVFSHKAKDWPAFRLAVDLWVMKSESAGHVNQVLLAKILLAGMPGVQGGNYNQTLADWCATEGKALLAEHRVKAAGLNVVPYQGSPIEDAAGREVMPDLVSHIMRSLGRRFTADDPSMQAAFRDFVIGPKEDPNSAGARFGAICAALSLSAYPMRRRTERFLEAVLASHWVCKAHIDTTVRMANRDRAPEDASGWVLQDCVREATSIYGAFRSEQDKADVQAAKRGVKALITSAVSADDNAHDGSVVLAALAPAAPPGNRGGSAGPSGGGGCGGGGSRGGGGGRGGGSGRGDERKPVWPRSLPGPVTGSTGDCTHCGSKSHSRDFCHGFARTGRPTAHKNYPGSVNYDDKLEKVLQEQATHEPQPASFTARPAILPSALARASTLGASEAFQLAVGADGSVNLRLGTALNGAGRDVVLRTVGKLVDEINQTLHPKPAALASTSTAATHGSASPSGGQPDIEVEVASAINRQRTTKVGQLQYFANESLQEGYALQAADGRLVLFERTGPDTMFDSSQLLPRWVVDHLGLVMRPYSGSLGSVGGPGRILGVVDVTIVCNAGTPLERRLTRASLVVPDEDAGGIFDVLVGRGVLDRLAARVDCGPKPGVEHSPCYDLETGAGLEPRGFMPTSAKPLRSAGPCTAAARVLAFVTTSGASGGNDEEYGEHDDEGQLDDLEFGDDLGEGIGTYQEEPLALAVRSAAAGVVAAAPKRKHSLDTCLYWALAGNFTVTSHYLLESPGLPLPVRPEILQPWDNQRPALTLKEAAALKLDDLRWKPEAMKAVAAGDIYRPSRGPGKLAALRRDPRFRQEMEKILQVARDFGSVEAVVCCPRTVIHLHDVEGHRRARGGVPGLRGHCGAHPFHTATLGYDPNLSGTLAVIREDVVQALPLLPAHAEDPGVHSHDPKPIRDSNGTALLQYTRTLKGGSLLVQSHSHPAEATSIALGHVPVLPVGSMGVGLLLSDEFLTVNNGQPAPSSGTACGEEVLDPAPSSGTACGEEVLDQEVKKLEQDIADLRYAYHRQQSRLAAIRYDRWHTRTLRRLHARQRKEAEVKRELQQQLRKEEQRREKRAWLQARAQRWAVAAGLAAPKPKASPSVVPTMPPSPMPSKHLRIKQGLNVSMLLLLLLCWRVAGAAPTIVPSATGCTVNNWDTPSGSARALSQVRQGPQIRMTSVGPMPPPGSMLGGPPFPDTSCMARPSVGMHAALVTSCQGQKSTDDGAGDASPANATTADGTRSVPPRSNFTKDPDQGYIWCERSDMNPQAAASLKALLKEREPIFARSLKDLGCYKGELGEMRITLQHDRAVWSGPRRHSPLEVEIQDAKCNELREAGIIRPSNSTKYAMNSTMPAKKAADGTWTDRRYCCDARRLNDATVPDKYCPPLPEELFERIGGRRWLTKADCRAAFNQIPLHLDDQEKTSFWWGNSLWCYVRCMYGARNATAVWQRVISHHIRKAGLQDVVFAFVDDCLIASNTAEEHEEHLRRFLDMMDGIGLKLHPEKTIVAADCVEFLGHMVSADGLQPTEAKIAAIQAIQPPRTLTELQSILGMVNYYRCYLPAYSDIVQPLYELTRKGVVWGPETWQPRHQAALDQVKSEFSKEGLILRRVDPSRPLILHTDFSEVGISAVLGQQDDQGNEYLCACVSRSLNVHERNYTSYKGEMLAACWAMKVLRPYLHGRHFTLVTDHAPLLWLMENENLTGQYARWALIMQDYCFDVMHRPGVLHHNADALSRSPVASNHDGTGARLEEDSDPRTPAPRLVTSLPRAPVATALALMSSGQALAASARAQVSVLAALSGVGESLSPSAEELLGGGNGLATDPTDRPPDPALTAAEQRIRELNITSNRIVRELARSLRATALESPRPRLVNGTVTVMLDTSLLSHHFLEQAHTQGLVMVECGTSAATALEAALRAGWRIRRYMTVGVPTTEHPRLKRRLGWLRASYPQQLKGRAIDVPWGPLPADEPVTEGHLVANGARNPLQWLVVGNLDATGANPERALQLIGALQSLQPRLPPGFLLTSADLPDSEERFGGSFTVDQARLGCSQHRLLRCWTNLGGATHLQRVTHHATWATLSKPAADALPGRVLPVALEPRAQPYLAADVPGRPVVMLPPGDLRSLALPSLQSELPSRLSASEVAAVLDIDAASITAPGPSAGGHDDAAIGALFDGVNTPAVERIFSAAQALQRAFVTPHHMARLSPKPAPTHQLGGGLEEYLASESPAAFVTVALQHNQCDMSWHTSLVAKVADAQEQAQGVSCDPWDDQPLLHYLMHGHSPSGVAGEAARRVVRRATNYRFDGLSQRLYRLMPNGTTREVPSPERRQSLIEEAHHRLGHWGARRTLGLLQNGHWWQGMSRDVEYVVNRCTLCDRANSSGNVVPSQLHSLPLRGPFYRWHVDLAGDLTPTPEGYRYVLVCVEAWTKHVEMIPLRTKGSQEVANAFLANVLARFSAPAEVVSDGGTEFQGAFAALLEQCFIDHRVTSPNHPQANGAAERVVQICKRALRKYCAEQGTTAAWVDYLPWILLGYRCSAQASTGKSPFELMYGAPPMVPVGTRHVFEAPLNPDQEPHQADQLLRLRADAVQRAAPAVGSNLLIAQHRDQHRYARVRAGGYKPRFTNFTVGDYVYVMLRNRNNTLQLPARETILRIVDAWRTSPTSGTTAPPVPAAPLSSTWAALRSSLLSFPTVRVTPQRQGPCPRPRP